MELTTGITREEMETIVLIDGSGSAYIDTTIPKMIRKCQKLGYETLREDTFEGRVVGACFKMPEKCVSFRKESKQLSEERRKELSDRMKQYHKKGGDAD